MLKSETNFESVGVVGLGYIGLPTAAILASRGVRVHGVDVNDETIEAIGAGRVPFVEPELGDLVHDAVYRGLLTASREPCAADAFVIAVPTPFHEDKSADLGYIESAGRSLAPKLGGHELIVLESTSPPGTTQHLANVILDVRPDLFLDTNDSDGLKFAHCPERVLPGKVMEEIVSNDRIIGGMSDRASSQAAALYRTFCEGEMLITNSETAEMAKLVENSYRDVNIAFANELSIISDRLNIDVRELIQLANHHPRVNILQPGPGVGGHCIAVDPWFIVAAAPEEANLIRQARLTNDSKPAWVLERIRQKLCASNGNTLAALGLSFKANIDDLRESPAMRIVETFADSNPEYTVLVVEPHIEHLPPRLSHFSNVQLVSLEESLRRADVAAILVGHDQFKHCKNIAFDPEAIFDTVGFLPSPTRTRSAAIAEIGA